MGPMLQFNTNMLEAAMLSNVDWYLYTSTVGVYEPAEVLYEDDVWKSQPSKNDRYGDGQKRIENRNAKPTKDNSERESVLIVRPANV